MVERLSYMLVGLIPLLINGVVVAYALTHRCWLQYCCQVCCDCLVGLFRFGCWIVRSIPMEPLHLQITSRS